MKHQLLFFISFIILINQAGIAKNRYVSVNGEGDGSSWDSPKGSIQSSIDNSQVGDTVYVSSGVYNEPIALKDGVSLLGGYYSQTGERDIERFETILDVFDTGKRPIVAYDNDFTNPTLVEGFTLKNGNLKEYGGGAYIRGNITLSHCYILNCSGTNGGGVYNDGGKVTDCIIELCSASSSAGGVYNVGGVVENTILRGNQGKYGTIRNEKKGTTLGLVNNCILANNEATVSGWPNSGGIYNPNGIVANCIVVSNAGSQYSAIHSNGKVINTICWNNKRDEGHGDVLAYFESGKESSNNAAVSGTSSACNVILNPVNNEPDGPHFKSPALFQGIPTTEADVAAMRAADWSFESSSPCLDKGIAEGAPAFDINGIERPKGEGYDIGAYEYDPDVIHIPADSVRMTVDTLKMVEGESQWLSAIVFPKEASNKKLSWTSLNEEIATVRNGLVNAVSVGKATIKVFTEDGNKVDSCIVIIEEKIIPKVHALVEEADLLNVEDYSVPSWTQMLIAKNTARIDSSEVNIVALRQAMDALISKNMPYCIVSNINGDPASQMAFAWFTNAGIDKGSIQLVAKGNATETDFETPALEANAMQKAVNNLNYAVTTSNIPKATGLPANTKYNYTSHKVVVSGLSPGTTYSYRVGFDGAWSEIYSFSTAKKNKDEFKFIYMTDSHIMDEEYVENVRWSATAVANQAPDAKFILFTGDFVETGTALNSEWEWEQWFDVAMKPALQTIPVVPTDGNHDDSPHLNYTYHFNTDSTFNVSAVVKPQFQGINHSFVYGDALFIVYSHQDYYKTGYLESSVKPWIREQVEKNPDTKWRIVAYHKNIFTGSGHQEDEDAVFFRQEMLPLFDELDIDFAIQGHDHVYEVIGPVDNKTRTLVPNSVSGVENVPVNTNNNMKGQQGGVFDVSKGTLYFVNGTSGRKRYYPNNRETMEELLPDHGVENYWDLFTGRFGQPGAPTFSEITVNTDEITVNTSTADQEGNVSLFDSFKIVKKQGGLGITDANYPSIKNAFPVPAFDKVNLPITTDIMKINAVDIFGRSYSLVFDQQVVDISFLNDGLYFLQVNTSDNIEVYKIIKETN